MKNFNFKDFKYALIDSGRKGYKEVLVTYNADNNTAKQLLFIKESKGKGNDYYISTAKKIIGEKIKNGQLAKTTTKQLKLRGVKAGGALKPVLITLAILVGLGGAGAGGYYITQYLGGGTGGGGVIPKPGDEVLTDVTVSNLPEGVSVTAGKKAVIGQDYDTTIYLNEVSSINANGFTLPTSLDKVSYKIGDKETEIAKENYTYTLDTTSDGDQANLHIAKEYVLGQIDVQLTLATKQATELTVTYGEDVVVKDVINKNIIPTGTKVPVKNKNLSLICEPGEGYELDHDSFSFGGATGVTWEYVPSTGEGEDSILTINGLASSCELVISPYIPGPGTITFNAHNASEPDSHGHIYFGVDEEEITDTYVIEISEDATSCKFKITADNGYLATQCWLQYTIEPGEGAKKENVPNDAYSFEGECLTVKDSVLEPKFKLKDISDLYITVFTMDEPDFVYASISIEGCTVTYGGVEYDKPATFKVYPDKKDNEITLGIKAKKGYAFTDECVMPLDPVKLSGVEQDGDYLAVSLIDVKSNFYVEISLIKLPDTCVYLDYESQKYYGKFQKLYEPVIYYEIEPNAEGADVEFYPYEEYKNNSFYFDISNTEGLEGLWKRYDKFEAYGVVQFSFSWMTPIKKGRQLALHMIPSTANPMLTLDSASKNIITLTDDRGKEMPSVQLPQPDYYLESTDIYFKFNDTEGKYEYNYSINAFINYEVTVKLMQDDIYCATINFNESPSWEYAYNLEFHVNRYNVYTATISEFAGFDNVEIYDERKDEYHEQRLMAGSHDVSVVDGDVVFGVDLVQKRQMIHKEDIVLEGNFTDYGCITDDDAPDAYLLIVHGVTGDFTIKDIKPQSSEVSIATSIAENYSGLQIMTPGGKGVESKTLTTTPQEVTYDATRTESYFDLVPVGSDVLPTIDTLCCIEYTTKNDETGLAYGKVEYYGDNGDLCFSGLDKYLYNIKSMVISITTYNHEFSTGAHFAYNAAKESPVEKVFVDGMRVWNEGASVTLYHSTVNVYIVSNDVLTEATLYIGGDKSPIEVKPVQYGEFNYMITIEAEDGDEISLNC